MTTLTPSIRASFETKDQSLGVLLSPYNKTAQSADGPVKHLRDVSYRQPCAVWTSVKIQQRLQWEQTSSDSHPLDRGSNCCPKFDPCIYLAGLFVGWNPGPWLSSSADAGLVWWPQDSGSLHAPLTVVEISQWEWARLVRSILDKKQHTDKDKDTDTWHRDRDRNRDKDIDKERARGKNKETDRHGYGDSDIDRDRDHRDPIACAQVKVPPF